MATAPEPDHAATSRPRARLLIVDDQPINIRLLHQIFCQDHDVYMAADGEQALLLCASLQPDLLLLDMQMPGMDGLSVCRRMREQPTLRHIPVIFVTGSDQPGGENACWEAGCVDFVSKPINTLTLRNRVNAHLLLKRQADQLRQLAFCDGLTGVANRRHFDERLEAAWNSCARQEQPCSALMIDVDHFKRYNDHYGHQSGDDCLRQVAAALSAGLKRPGDMAARYGGEEFACLLPATGRDGACLIAAALERAVRTLELPHACAEHGQVTVSIGVATLLPRAGVEAAALIAAADTQLYLAKQAGRACYRAAGA